MLLADAVILAMLCLRCSPLTALPIPIYDADRSSGVSSTAGVMQVSNISDFSMLLTTYSDSLLCISAVCKINLNFSTRAVI